MRPGVRTARRLVAEYGVRGFKFHPSDQGFYPNDPAVYPLYEVIAEAGCSRCSTVDRPVSVPVSRAAAGSG